MGSSLLPTVNSYQPIRVKSQLEQIRRPAYACAQLPVPKYQFAFCSTQEYNAQHVASAAEASFQDSCADIQRLLEIHVRLTGSGPGRRWRMEVLNKSAVVLLCAVWEGYCEDLVSEAVSHLVKHVESPNKLPKELRKQIAKQVKADLHELSPWQLAGDLWKDYMVSRLADMKRHRDFDWMTPKSANVDDIFEEALGIEPVTSSWAWQNMTPKDAAATLDELVTLRGKIAHRGQATQYVTKTDVTKYLTHVRKLVVRTDRYVSDQLQTLVGMALQHAGH